MNGLFFTTVFTWMCLGSWSGEVFPWDELSTKGNFLSRMYSLGGNGGYESIAEVNSDGSDGSSSIYTSII